MSHHFNAHIVWIGAERGPAATYDGYFRDYLIEIDGKPPLKGSSVPVYRGDPGLHNPEDLLVASLSACHMLWYLHLCTDAGVQVSAYQDRASGVMNVVDGRLRFTDVLLRPDVEIIKGEEDFARELHQDANRACFIANSVNFPVRHEARISKAHR